MTVCYVLATQHTLYMFLTDLLLIVQDARVNFSSQIQETEKMKDKILFRIT